MKKIMILLLALVAFNAANAQFLRFGIKGGVSSTNVKFDRTTLDQISTNDGVKDFVVEQGDSKMGIHLGFFGRIQVLGLFIQPELLFTHSQGEVVLNDVTASKVYNETQKFNKIDIPVLVGWKFGPARLGFGPVASIMMSEKDGLKDRMNDFTDNAESNFKKATFGYQVGLGLDILKKITLDVRYEGNFSKLGSGITLGGEDFKFDQRNPQFLFSAGIFF
ncbi:hypothetical protein CYCD_25580 [Tenuifilaceae bacterium CYCD]|nr:hypothetical protein CYCD_25580 [Tenuifilaceae bacterium CYCD]